jgi:hypothetical protein
LGVILGGAAVGLLTTKLVRGRIPLSSGVFLVVLGIAAFLFCESAWSLIQPLPATTRADAQLSKQAAEYPESPLVNTGFLAWARGMITQAGGNETFWLAPPSAEADALTYQWTTYQLLPAQEVSLGQARWVVIYGADPRGIGFPRAGFRRLVTYGKGFALAERTDVG